MKKLKLIGLFILLYIVIYVVISFATFSAFPTWPSSESLRNFYQNLSYLTPALIFYGDGGMWGIISTQSFNIFYPIVNLLYTGIVYYLIMLVKRKANK